LRAHGDIAAVDAVTGNPYNGDTWEEHDRGSPTIPVGYGLCNVRWPGYGNQWDQMLYRDIDISNTTRTGRTPVAVRPATAHGTARGVTHPLQLVRPGPLSTAVGNHQQQRGRQARRRSFMVYVGRRWQHGGRSGWFRRLAQVYDPVRRWFGELIKASGRRHYQLFTTGRLNPRGCRGLGRQRVQR
jgi:hypothetical protein